MTLGAKANLPEWVKFLVRDNSRGLFPLRCTTAFARLDAGRLRDFVYGTILGPSSDVTFLVCPEEYALKDRLHLRKTLVLDPVASCFLYSFVFTHRAKLRRKPQLTRRAFGYELSGASMANPFEEYHDFRKRKYELKGRFAHHVRLDIANCFNSFYHHDMIGAVTSRLGQGPGQQLGKFLREINGGRSVNCFPQGIYPAKALGSWFLSFIEQSHQLESDAIIRFLDDIYLFSNSEATIHQDILTLQRILGTHALSLNAEKTRFGSQADEFVEGSIEAVKLKLLKKREERLGYAVEDSVEELPVVELDEEETEYLHQIVRNRHAAEEDVELALMLLRDDADVQIALTQIVLDQYPHLVKTLYGSLRDSAVREDELFAIMRQRLQQQVLSNFELFWLVRIALDHFKMNRSVAEFVMRVYSRAASIPVVRAAILETGNRGYGFDDLRSETLRNEPGGLVGVAAVVGLRKTAVSQRNQQYKYAARQGPHMKVLCEIMSSA